MKIRMNKSKAVFLSGFLCFVVLAACFTLIRTNERPASASAATVNWSSTGITYQYTSQAYTVTGYDYYNLGEYVEIAETYNDGINGEWPVTEIGYWAFGGNLGMKGVKISNGIQHIREGAFQGCAYLVQIDMSNCLTLRSIGFAAFAFIGYNNVPDIVLPNGLTHIYGSAFRTSGSGDTRIFIPSSVSYIESMAFAGNFSNIEVDPANIHFTDIDGVLYGKDNLEISKIMQYPYGKDYAASYIVPEGVTSIEEGAFILAKVASVALPRTVITIDAFAFNSCEEMTHITIPYGVEEIGDYAFGYCLNLTQITIPNSVSIMGGGVFSDSRNLQDIYISPGTDTSEWNPYWRPDVHNSPLLTVHWTGWMAVPSVNLFPGKQIRITVSFTYEFFASGEDYTDYGTRTFTNISVPVYCGYYGGTSSTIPTNVFGVWDEAYVYFYVSGGTLLYTIAPYNDSMGGYNITNVQISVEQYY